MSTGGHFKHIIITFYHASATKALSRQYVFTDMPARGKRRFHCGHRRLNIITLHFKLFILHQVEDCQMKGNEEKYMLGEELALFTHHHRDWSLLPLLSPARGLNWEVLHLKCMHALPLKCILRSSHAAAQLGNVLHFIKKISLPTTECRHVLLLMSLFPSLISPHIGMSGDKQFPRDASGTQSSASETSNC